MPFTLGIMKAGMVSLCLTGRDDIFTGYREHFKGSLLMMLTWTHCFLRFRSYARCLDRMSVSSGNVSLAGTGAGALDTGPVRSLRRTAADVTGAPAVAASATVRDLLDSIIAKTLAPDADAVVLVQLVTSCDIGP